MKKVYVYTIVNTKGGVEYVGETTMPKKRFYNHKSKLRSAGSGRFGNREDVFMNIVAEFNNRKDAFDYQCNLQKQYGFETDVEKRLKVHKIGGYNGGQVTAQRYSKAVLVYEYNSNKFIGEFESQRKASIKLNLNNGNVTSVLNGKYKQTGGYKIIYK
jgi:predicted GIY-YIG superfamily endonuclease